VSRSVLTVEDLRVGYRLDNAEVEIVSGVSFELERGEALALAGESGCGKTTTALAIVQLLDPHLQRFSGTIDLATERGVVHMHRRTERGMRDLRWAEVSLVFQGALNALDPVQRISRQIAEAVRLHDPEADRPGVRRRVDELLERVGISPARADQYPHELSGGMRQRVMIALAHAAGELVLVLVGPLGADADALQQFVHAAAHGRPVGLRVVKAHRLADLT